MLRFILGRAGSGKTELLRTELKTMAQAAQKKIMLIVPEQSSFENERAMLRLLGAKDVQRISVTSFSRLADLVFRRYGGGAGRRLDDGGRSIFMSLALEQVKDQLSFYRKNAESTELVGLMISASTELKMCDVTPLDIERAAGDMPQSTLRQKMTELSLILSAYDALVAQSFVDPLDDLTRLKNTLQEHHFFSEYTVALDSFQSFTVQEYHIISLILSQADDLSITLCTDQLDDPEHGMGLFSLVRRTGKNLMQLARRNDVKIASPVVLAGGARFQSKTLAGIEAGVFRCGHAAQECENDGDVVLYEANNLYDESAFVAATIRRLVMEKGFRYRDFAIITRSTDRYRGVLDLALERWEIPYFMDRPQAIDAEPLMRLVLSAFKTVQSGFSSDSVFSYLKTGLTALRTDEISQLENYVFVWGIEGKQWKEDWTEHPRGFAETMTDSDLQRLTEINESRKAVMKPLLRFSSKLRDTDGEGMAAAVYELLQDVGAAEHLKNLAQHLAECGEPELADRQLRLWDLLMTILDQTALVLQKNPVTAARYAELLRLVILANRMASIPQGLDEVTVGAADRTRTGAPKVVFLMGTVQGEFPLSPGGDCVFSDGERRELIRLGLPLNDTLEGTAVQERFLAYAAMSAASEKLYITYPLTGPAGEPNTPSSIPNEVCSVLKNTSVINELILPQTYFANAKEPAFELMAQQWKHNTVLSATLKDLFGKRGCEHRLSAIDRAAQNRPAVFASSEKAKALFGENLHVSATQIEKFYLCRFQYFCRFGLNAKERRAAELDALEYGSLMHFLLEKLFRDAGSAAILQMSPEELKKEILRLLNLYVETKMGGAQNKSPRFVYLFLRLADSAQIIASHIAKELAQSEFHPVDFELAIGADGIPPLCIPLPDGGQVEIDGKIDRVDLLDRDGISFVRVIDYKTGHKEFKLSDILYGVNMQMLIYLAALLENGGDRYGEVRPAGVLYMPANRPAVSASRSTDAEKIEQEAAKKLRMDGLVLDDPAMITAMEHSGQGNYLPVALKDGVPAKRDHVVSSGELASVMKHIKELVGAMAKELHGGDVSAVPLSGTYDACAWCPYASVCGHERDDPTREMQQWDRDEVIKELTQAKEGMSNERTHMDEKSAGRD
ncbi:PD-(D/E)XK nuclease family protein [Caproiciproducens sp. AGMB10547]|uniref:PD-(D/E)XK nuclease family protein n=2 Tax=Caproiciproducens faecalis TaxID=2820301 RepID=A0ABS7DR38_9FIRM|nr:PD-(D/E)XK nuclease family protein [Caproiciproducens faecalis]